MCADRKIHFSQGKTSLIYSICAFALNETAYFILNNYHNIDNITAILKEV